MRPSLRASVLLAMAGVTVLGVCRAGSSGGASTASRPAAPIADRSSTVRNPEFLAQFAATRGFSHGTPKSITITPDGSAVLFLRSGPRSFVQDLFTLDTATGAERVLLTADQILGGGEEKLTAEELARRERMRMASRGIASYQLSTDGKQILVPLSGRLFVFDRAGGVKKEVVSKGGFPIDPRFSPDGTKVACVRDGDLYVTSLADGSETRLTTKTGDTITNGLAEFVAQEEMDRFQGFWWSPDSNWIAYQQTDTAGMETFHIADGVNPGKEPDAWPYPRPGKANAKVKLGVIAVSGGGTTWVQWDSTKHEYLARVTWSKNAPLCLLVQNRAQTEQVLMAVSNDGSTRELLRERDAAWLNLEGKFPKWLKDGSGFLWMTESRGFWQLERRKGDGTFDAVLTPPEMGLEGLVHFDEAAQDLYLSASTDTTESHVWMSPLRKRMAPHAITHGAGRHSVIVAEESDWCVETSVAADGTTRWTARRLGGGDGKAWPMRATRETPPWTPNLKLDTVDAGRTRGMRAAIIRPRDFKSGSTYPVIVNVYGGPHAKTVHSTPQSYYLQQWIADQGFIVVTLDGRGTPGRGRDWERAIHMDLIGPALDDQAAGLKALAAKHPEMDLSRVGIYGWSFGGYFSAHAAMQRPDVYHAGCAGAPVADWMDYDTHYTERYMGVPGGVGAGMGDDRLRAQIAAAYDKSNVLTYCKDLRVPMLIIHGTSDDNVYFMHSLKMSQALFRAGKHFEFLPLAGFTHMVPDPEVTTRLYTRIAEFFLKNVAQRNDTRP